MMKVQYLYQSFITNSFTWEFNLIKKYNFGKSNLKQERIVHTIIKLINITKKRKYKEKITTPIVGDKYSEIFAKKIYIWLILMKEKLINGYVH